MSGFRLQRLGGVVHDDPAALDQIAMGDDIERRDRVLLDQQDRQPFLPVDAADDLEDLRDQEWRQPEARLVEHQQFWLRHQGASDRQHLLFAAGQIAGSDRAAFVEAGKIAVDPFPVAGHVVTAAHGRGRDEVLVGRQVLEHPPSLEHVGDAELDALLRHQRADAAAEKREFAAPDLAAFGGEQAADRFQRGALAGAIGAQQRHHAALGDVERDALDRKRNIVVDDFDVVERECLGGGLRVHGLIAISSRSRTARPADNRADCCRSFRGRAARSAGSR